MDIDLHELPALRRISSLDWNPLPLFTLDRISGNVVFVPVHHDMLEVKPFHAATGSVPIYVYNDRGHPKQGPDESLSGTGAEITYRYRGADGERHGLFLLPSLILGSLASRGRDGQKNRFFDLGLAVDAGYEAQLAGGVSLSVAAGLQSLWTGGRIPHPLDAGGHAHLTAAPRLLVSLSWAF